MCTSPDYVCLVKDTTCSLSKDEQTMIFVEWLKKITLEFFKDGEEENPIPGASIDQAVSVDHCRMIHSSTYDRLIDLIKGEEVIWLDGKSKPDRATRFIPHGVVVIKNPEKSTSRLLTEETFGPVLPVMIFDTFDE